MATRWYRWHGQHLSEQQHTQSGVRQAQHRVAVYFYLAQHQINVHKATPLPRLGKGRQTRRRFWAAWLARWHTLLDSGFDLAQSLEQLLQQSQFQEEASLCQAALEALQQGKPLAQVFQQGGLTLPARSLQLLTFAEQAGQIDLVVKQLSNLAQQTHEQSKQLRQALLYPSAVLSMVVLLGIGLKAFVLPKFAALYASTAVELPALTQLLLTPSSALSKTALVVLFACLALILAVTRIWFKPALASCTVRKRLSKLPLWSSWVERSFIQQDFQALALALQHGMTLQQALVSIIHTHPCKYRQFLWLQGLHALQRGRGAAAIFAEQELKPAERALIQVGEQTGRLETKLAHIAKQQQQHFAQRKKNVLALLPNIILILVSIVTAAVMIALYLPLFQLGLAVT